jgi:hypothetical protein
MVHHVSEQSTHLITVETHDQSTNISVSTAINEQLPRRLLISVFYFRICVRLYCLIVCLIYRFGVNDLMVIKRYTWLCSLISLHSKSWIVKCDYSISKYIGIKGTVYCSSNSNFSYYMMSRHVSNHLLLLKNRNIFLNNSMHDGNSHVELHMLPKLLTER